ncbi:MAG: ABC transporter permease [Ruminococcaceae bacterium]|nr:ABC transporter permease [Oscillospiraceae bacterium]
MRNIYFQMVHSLKCIFKDTKPLISKLLTFAIVILVLGSAFSETFEATSMEPVRVAVLNEDQGPVGQMIVDWLEGNDNAFDAMGQEPQTSEPEAQTQDNEASMWLTAVRVDSFEEGQKLAEEKDDDQRISAVIAIPSDFSAKMLSSEKTAIEIHCGRASAIEATVVECVFDTFVTSFNYRTALEELGQQVINELSTEESIKQMDMGDVDSPDAMSYYAIAMLMMTLLYSAEYGVNGIADDYLGVIGERIRTTPIKPYQQYTGKILGMCIASTFQGLFIVLLTGLAYGANWGSNYLLLVAIIFSMSMVATTFGALFCMITRDGQKAQAFVTVLVIACTFLAGGFVKIDMGAVKFLSPNYYAQTAMFNSIYGGDMSIAYSYIGVLWGFAIAASALALALSRRKRA